jgi:hypothetical protein
VRAALFGRCQQAVQVVESSVKARVMHSCFFVLMSTFLRLDGVSGIVREVRLCHVFGSAKVLRDVRYHQAPAAAMASKSSHAVPSRAPGTASESHILSTSPFAPEAEQLAARSSGQRFFYDAQLVRETAPPSTHLVTECSL